MYWKLLCVRHCFRCLTCIFNHLIPPPHRRAKYIITPILTQGHAAMSWRLIWTWLYQTPKPVLFPLGGIPFFGVNDTIFGEIKQKCPSLKSAVWGFQCYCLFWNDNVALAPDPVAGLREPSGTWEQRTALNHSLSQGHGGREMTSSWVEGEREGGWLLSHSLPHKPHVEWPWLFLKTIISNEEWCLHILVHSILYSILLCILSILITMGQDKNP